MADKPAPPKKDEGTWKKVKDLADKGATSWWDIGPEHGIVAGALAIVYNLISGRGEGVKTRTIDDEALFEISLVMLRAAGNLGGWWAYCLETMNEIARKIHAIHGVDLRSSLTVGLGDKPTAIREKIEATQTDMLKQKTETERENWLRTTLLPPIGLVRDLIEKVEAKLDPPHILHTASLEERTKAMTAVVQFMIDSEKWPGDLRTRTIRKVKRWLGGMTQSPNFPAFASTQKEGLEQARRRASFGRKLGALGISVTLIVIAYGLSHLISFGGRPLPPPPESRIDPCGTQVEAQKHPWLCSPLETARDTITPHIPFQKEN